MLMVLKYVPARLFIQMDCLAPQVIGIILRGIFLLRKKEINWFYQEGASAIFPDGRNTPIHSLHGGADAVITCG